MRPIDIRIELLKRGYTFADVARRLNLSQRTVQTVVYRNGKSQRVARLISQFTAIPVDDLWPGAYNYRARRRP
jgi:lambda repressor-like predicted transcriptional regulator